MTREPVRVGIVGCGAISGAYLDAARRFPVLQIVSCADLDANAARAKAAEFAVKQVYSVESLLADPAVEVVLNLTVPKAHAAVSLAAIAAGKHVYTEKPLAVDRAEARQVLDAARAANVRVGCAADTFLGAGLQTARRLIDSGAIGRPVAFTGGFTSPGHERWHPNPAFFYDPGGGPMLDMGPYYLTALLNLLGPIRRVMGSASIAIPERTIAKGPKAGTKIPVHTPDHICGTIEFENGATGTLLTSFACQDTPFDERQPITIFGTEGTMRLPDPNHFDGPVTLRAAADKQFREIPPMSVTGYGRSVGLADMAHAIRAGRPHRAGGELAFAALDAMLGFTDSAQSGTAYAPSTRVERPAPMPEGTQFGTFEE